MDIAQGERAEVELDAFIEPRSRRDPDADEHEELWKASVRAYEEQRRQVARLEWHRFHRGQAERHRRTLEDLIGHHETQAERLCDTETTKGT